MADFSTVHQAALREARLSFDRRDSDQWSIVLREPIGGPFDPVPESVSFVTLRMVRGKLHPANQVSADLIADWCKRHAETPNEAFAHVSENRG